MLIFSHLAMGAISAVLLPFFLPVKFFTGGTVSIVFMVVWIVTFVLGQGGFFFSQKYIESSRLAFGKREKKNYEPIRSHRLKLELTGTGQLFAGDGGMTVEVVRGFGFYPSDQRHFRLGTGVCALKKNRVFGYYMDKIHTGKDTVLDEENVRILRDGVMRLVTQ